MHLTYLQKGNTWVKLSSIFEHFSNFDSAQNSFFVTKTKFFRKRGLNNMICVFVLSCSWYFDDTSTIRIWYSQIFKIIKIPMGVRPLSLPRLLFTFDCHLNVKDFETLRNSTPNKYILIYSYTGWICFTQLKSRKTCFVLNLLGESFLLK